MMRNLSNIGLEQVRWEQNKLSLRESQGNGCGSVGKAVASDTRDLGFKSRHWQNFIYQMYNLKDANKVKEARNGSSLKRA